MTTSPEIAALQADVADLKEAVSLMLAALDDLTAEAQRLQRRVLRSTFDTLMDGGAGLRTRDLNERLRDRIRRAAVWKGN